MQPPAGYIPPEFREFIYEELSEADIKAIQETAGYLIHGQMVPFTRAEVLDSGIRKVIGVRDTRNK